MTENSPENKSHFDQQEQVVHTQVNLIGDLIVSSLHNLSGVTGVDAMTDGWAANRINLVQTGVANIRQELQLEQNTKSSETLNQVNESITLLDRIDRWIMPAPHETRQEFDKLRARHRNKSDDEFAKWLITRQALICGVFGFFTGIGGICTTVLFTIPMDFLYSTRSQSSLLYYMAYLYGTPDDIIDLKTINYIILAGGITVKGGKASRRVSTKLGTKATRKAATKAVRRIFLRSTFEIIFRVIPFAGAILGFAVNFLEAKFVGHLALRWYRDNLWEQLVSQVSFTE